MNGRPHFFDAIRKRSSELWDQLEGNPELAGPWHQLFKQVQSPRHVLSELLQNADDAGATEASVRIESQCFVFSHNGEDFNEEHFASLCRFGYSNKRALHTIGFRGIGFKSTFSLGGSVQLLTPSLSVAFHRKRFTEPKWVDGAPSKPGTTEVRVPISDGHREKEVSKNLQEWLKSPVSLLFFRNLRRLQISDHQVSWGSLGPGPVADAEWMALDDDAENAFLVARSRAEDFPEDALLEIREERLLSEDQVSALPPCKVEIVLGAPGRLYVVLPTGIETALPFACNAPFIQDPAREKIKDPATSPTNRWLLGRIGNLAGTVLRQWLGNDSLSLEERSRAYGLLSDVDRDDNSSEGVCATIVEEALDEVLGEQPFLLTNDGKLTPPNQSVIFPEELYEIWGVDQIGPLFDGDGRRPFSRHVAQADRQKLLNWGVVDQVDKEKVLSILQSKHLPQPRSWRRLLKLWAYAAPDITGWRFGPSRAKLRIVPAQGKDVLWSASEIVRLGEKRLLQSDEDWEFLSAHLLVLNPNWPRFIGEQLRASEESEDLTLKKEADAAKAVLIALSLESASDVGKVIDQVAAEFFAQESVPLASCIQLAQIAAKLGATAGESFCFATRDRRLRSRDHIVLHDPDGGLEYLLPDGWRAEHLLHSEYSKSFGSCTAEEWRRWVVSGRSGLHEFAPLKRRRVDEYGRKNLEVELRRRGSSSPPMFHYKTSAFLFEDWDFDEVFWRHWTAAAKEDDRLWARVAGRILEQPSTFWSGAASARALQIATNGSTRAVTADPLLSSWILKLGDLPCLPDSRGRLRKPGEMLLWTPETVPFVDIEHFVDKLLDRETTRPLLVHLGVGDSPAGPDRLLDRIRTLAQSEKVPVQEVEKWYRRLDQMLDTCSSDDLARIKNAFRDERLIYTEASGWVASTGVYLNADEEDVPGAALIRASVRDLALWRKLGVPDRPTVDRAIGWLRQLPSGQLLAQDDARRVRSLLGRHSERIWNECGHWLNLAREWVPVDQLEYAITMQTLTEYSHMHVWVRQQTADLQRLPVGAAEVHPFSALPRLASVIEERFHERPLLPRATGLHPWLGRFGIELGRIELDDELETQRVRALAAELAKTEWQVARSLEIVPYIDGAPAGTPRRTEVVWLDQVLYVEDLPTPKLARLIPERLGKIFDRSEITAALNYCFGRSADQVTEYFEENFILCPRSERRPEEKVEPGQHVSSEDAPAPPDDETAKDAADDGIDASAGSLAVDPASDEFELAEASSAAKEPEPVDPPHVSRHTPPRPAKASIIERFARSMGFKKDGESRFFHSDGSWIGQTHDAQFPWERRTASGDLVTCYWPKDHCLELQPLQLDADTWSLVDKFPTRYAFILSSPQGDPVEMPGERLRAMRDAGKLILYPATYRLVVDHDR